MTVTPHQVYEALVRQRHDGRVDLPAAVAAEPDLAGLAPAITSLRLGTSWRVDGVTVAEDATRATLTGTARLKIGAGAEFAVGVTLRYQRDGFELRLATSPGWRFGTAFAGLPRTPTAVNHVLEHRPSFLNDLAVASVVFVATAGATNSLRLTGSLTAFPPFTDFFGPFPLRFDGPLALGTGAPALDLVAPSNRPSVTLGPVALSGFRLRLATEHEPGAAPLPDRSVAYGEATLRIGTHEVLVSTPLLASGSTWLFTGTFADAHAPTLTSGLASVATLLGLPDAVLAAPRTFADFTGFRLVAVDLALTPATLALEHLGVIVGSGARWTPPVPYLTFRDVGMRWVVQWSGTDSVVAGSFFGTVDVGPAAEPTFSLDATLLFPSFAISGVLAAGEVPLDAVLGWLLGASFPVPLAVRAFAFEADLPEQTFTARATITTDLTVSVHGVDLALTELYVTVDAAQDSVSGGVRGTFLLPGKAPDHLDDAWFEIGVEVPGDGVWTIEGGLLPDEKVVLKVLVARFMASAVDHGLPEVAVTDLALSVLWSTEPLDRTYRVRGAVAGTWREKVLGQLRDLAFGAEVDVTRDRAGVRGRLAGRFSVNRLEVRVGVDFAATTLVYLLEVRFGDLWFQAIAGKRGTPAHEYVSIRVGGLTLGEAIDHLCGLADPTAEVVLAPPWDRLREVDLSAFVLTVDPTESLVEFAYAVDVELGVLAADRVGLSWRRLPDGTQSVALVLTGRFLDREYPATRPLTWNLLADDAPAVPGRGAALVDLEYLGVGQSVAPRGVLPLGVAATVERLRTAMPPVPPGGEPITPTGGVVFDPDAGWLVALRAVLLDTVDLSIAFLDPDLYGLAVALRGGRAGSLAGLRFEVGYRKVASGVGVFRGEVRLPEVFRRLQLGPVSVTAGTVVVEVHTDGGFAVDLGFPEGTDFGRSFEVEVLPFLGRGGVRFGHLRGVTSSRVPTVADGAFGPVLELGVALAVGVGKEVRVGPLEGAAYIEVVGIFEGVLSWFTPTRDGEPPSVYYWARAVVAVHGRIHVRADFSVVRVDFTVDAWASVSAVLESHRATPIRLRAEIVAKASVAVGFVTVSFSRTERIAYDLVIGVDRPTPWIVTGGQSAPTSKRLRANVLPPVRRELAVVADQPVVWNPTTRVFADSPRTVGVTLLPAFSIAGIAVGWGHEPAAPANPVHRAALLLFAPVSDPTIAEALLRWCVAAVTGAPSGGRIDVGRLHAVLTALRDPERTATPFGIDALKTFFATNLRLEVAGRPAGPDPVDVAGMVVAMPPVLAWTSPQAVGRDLATFTMVGPRYRWSAGVRAARQDVTPPPRKNRPPDPREDYRSFASDVFRDWCLCLTTAVVREAVDLLGRWPVELTTTPVSLAALAERFPTTTVTHTVRSGDTPDDVAQRHGVGTADLLFHDPTFPARLAATPAGGVLDLALGVTPTSLALANDDFRLTASAPVPLGAIDYQVDTGDTLATIAQRFGIGVPALVAAVASDRRLLRAGAALRVPAFTLTGAPDALAAAATMFVRYESGTDYDGIDWYLQAVTALNPTYTGGVGVVLRVPVSFGDQKVTTEYRTRRGDGTWSIAAALVLRQRPGGPAGWPAFRDAVHAVEGGFRVPEHGTTVRPGDNLTALVDRLLLTAAPRHADVLAPSALIAVPGVTATLGPGHDTLGALAAEHALTVADLAVRIQDVPLFARTADGGTVVVPNPPTVPVEELVVAATTATRLEGLAAGMSRQLLSGQRVPRAVDVDGHVEASPDLAPLHDLTGQQFDGPRPDSAKPGVVALRIAVTSSAAWVTFRHSSTVDGAVVRGATTPGLVLEFTNAELAQRYPATTLKLDVVRAPEPLPRGEDAPVTYGLGHRVELQSPVALPVTSTAAGNPSLWSLPSALRRRAATTPTTRYDVVRAVDHRSEPITGAVFATAVTFGVHALDHGCAPTGAESADREPLLALRRHLARGGTASAFLAVEPPPDAGNTSGLVVLPASGTATFLLKTNESTTARPPGAGVAPPHAASLDQVADFVSLLWQGVVVGGEGYVLRYRSTTGDDLPPGLFDRTGRARVTLLVVVGGRTAPDLLHPFDTSVLVPAGVDPTTSALYVEAATPGADTVPTPVVAPGLIGFRATLAEPTTRTGRLFGLLTWSTAALGPPMLPVPPDADDGTGLPAWHRDRLARAHRPTAEPVHWGFRRMIPHARLAGRSPAPAVPGLPPPADDPYRGVSATPTAITLGVSDVLGNPGASTPPRVVDGPTTYTDTLLSVAQWPAVALSYSVRTGTTLVVTLEPQAGSVAPGAAPRLAIEEAARQAERYATAYYQLAGDRVTAAVVTTLAAEPLVVDGKALWRLAAASYLAAKAAESVEAVTWTGVLDQVAAARGVSLADLAEVNAERPVRELFGSAVPVVPGYAVATAGASADSVVAGLPTGVPRPASGGALLSLPQNGTLALRADRVLTVPAAAVTGSHATLATAAAAAHTLPGLLAAANADVAGLLRVGSVLEWDGVVLPVPEPRSFTATAAAFTALGYPVDPATLGATNAEQVVLDPLVSLTTKHYVTREGDTLAANASGVARTVLAGANGAVVDLVDAGTVLYLGDVTGVTVPATQSLRALADRYGCPLPLLLAANRSRTITGATLPGRVTVPGTVKVPYRARPAETLAGIAPRFGVDALALGRANAAMPGILAPGQTVRLADPPRTTGVRADDTIEALRGRLLDAPLDEVITAASTLVLAPEALLVCPPAVLPTTGRPVTPVAAAARYGLDAGAFGRANAAVQGLVAAGVPLTRAGVTVTTGAEDTLNAVVSRFAARDVVLTVAELVAAFGETAFLRGGTTALLPPAPVTLRPPLHGAPPASTAPFPLTVALRFTRPTALVDSSLDAGVADAAVPPLALGTPLTLAQFEAWFRQEYPALRLATAGQGGDLVVVPFGPAGIGTVDVGPGLVWNGTRRPRVFAIRPLSTHPVARVGVPVCPMRPDGTLAPHPSPIDVDNVDLEALARRFLADVDLFLGPGYAPAVHADPRAAGVLGRVLAAKRTLVAAVARGLAPVCRVEDPHAVAARAAAVALLADDLAVTLSRAYDLTALVQYDATVTPRSTGPGRRLHGSATSPADATYTLSAASTDLSAATSHVGFPLRVPDARAAESVAVDLDYGFSHLEYDITPEPGVDGYSSSRWATFLPPLTGTVKPAALRTDLGSTTVPVPLRAYPPTPVLAGQTAEAAAPTTVSRCPLWTYSVEYAHEHAAQDEVVVEVDFDVVEAPRDPRTPTDDLVCALTCYAAVAEEVWALLADYDATPGERTANAARSFASLVEQVATTWTRWWDGQPAATAHPDLAYAVRWEGTATEYTAVVLTRSAGDRWPEVAYAGTHALAPDPPVGSSRTYRFAAPVHRVPWPRLRLSWPDLTVTGAQNARATIRVHRNAHLLPDGPPTDERFVFHAAPVTAPHPVAPLNLHDGTLDITSLGTLSDALATVLTTLAGTGAPLGTVAVDYAFDLAPGLPNWTSATLANLPLSAANGREVARRVGTWLDTHRPVTVTGRRLRVAVTVYSTLTGHDDQPVLHVADLRYRL
ncbi:LysM peptidoglycan-binding domain-containing protein [Actinosynnema sp. NPDC020468]|uniref:LysM peptidoglycan-binding domain-containing protein n=1 Tax=Actinosynnema sp. NPDC020468 TaxID=3154488 RepID=UPI0034055CFF